MKKRACFLLLFLMISGLGPKVVHALTLSEIKTEIRLRIKDTDSARRRYSDAQLLNFINQAQRDIINVSWMIKKSTTIVTAVDFRTYQLPSDFIDFYRVTHDHSNIPETSEQELDSQFNFGTWHNTEGKPNRYYQDFVSIQDNASYITVYPFPGNTSSTGTLRITYYSQGTDLSADADVPFDSRFIFYPYHDLLIFDPCYKIFLIEGEIDKASEYRSYYEARLRLLLEKVDLRPNFLPGFSGQRK